MWTMGWVVYVIILLVILVLGVSALIYAFHHIFVQARRAKKGNSLEMFVAEGVPNMAHRTLVLITLDDTCVTIKSVNGSETAKVDYSKITNLGIVAESEIFETEKKRSVAGRAVVGGLLFGRTGAIVGGMTGLKGSEVKTEELTTRYFIINYVSSVGEEPKVLSFIILDETWKSGLSKFEENLRNKTGLQRKPLMPETTEENIRL